MMDRAPNRKRPPRTLQSPSTFGVPAPPKPAPVAPVRKPAPTPARPLAPVTPGLTGVITELDMQAAESRVWHILQECGFPTDRSDRVGGYPRDMINRVLLNHDGTYLSKWHYQLRQWVSLARDLRNLGIDPLQVHTLRGQDDSDSSSEDSFQISDAVHAAPAVADTDGQSPASAATPVIDPVATEQLPWEKEPQPDPTEVTTVVVEDVVADDRPATEELPTTTVVADDTERPRAVGDPDDPQIPTGDMFGRFAHQGGASGPHDTA